MERRDDNSASATVEQRISSADLRNRALAAAAADDEDITAISPLYSASSDLISDFQTFCRSQGYIDYDCVSEAKVVAYLEDRITKPLENELKSGNCTANATDNTNGSKLHLQSEYDRAVHAVLQLSHLWEQQRNQGTNSNLYPNGAQLERTMRFFATSKDQLTTTTGTAATNTAADTTITTPPPKRLRSPRTPRSTGRHTSPSPLKQRARSEELNDQNDPDENSDLHGKHEKIRLQSDAGSSPQRPSAYELTEREVDEITAKCWDWSDSNGRQAAQRWIMFCSAQVCRGMNLKASQFRIVGLPHLKVLHLGDMAHINDCGPLFAVFLPSFPSEDSPSANVKCCMSLRHENVFACPIGTIALQFFWRWHICKDRFPNFGRPKSWKSMGICRLDHGESEIPKMYIYNRKYTLYHSIGVSIAKTPNESGVSYELTIKKSSASDSVRLDQSSLEALLRRGGVLEELQQLRRSQLDECPGRERMSKTPSHRLLKMVFPESERWVHEEMRSPGLLDSDAVQFLEFLSEMKTVFLQDSVFYKRRFPANPIWRSSLFRSQEYQDFEAQFADDLRLVPCPSRQLSLGGLSGQASLPGSIGSTSLQGLTVLPEASEDMPVPQAPPRGFKQFVSELSELERATIDKLYRNFEQQQRADAGDNFDEQSFEYIRGRMQWQFSTEKDWPRSPQLESSTQQQQIH